MRLAGQAGHQSRRDTGLASQGSFGQEESRGCWREGLQLLADCDRNLAHPATLTAAAVTAPGLLGLGGQLFGVRGLAGLHSGG